MKKIVVFNWGEISIHTYYLIEQLRTENILVELFLYTPLYGYKRLHLYYLVRNLKENVRVIEIMAKPLETKVIKLNRIANFFRFRSPTLCINPFLPLRTRKKFDSDRYDYIITVKQSALYWLYKTDKSCLKKVIHYSLEIEKISDPVIFPHSCLYKLIQKEEAILPGVLALIIQDEYRANALLDSSKAKFKLKQLFIPISVPGEVIREKSDYLFNKLKIRKDKKIILYYGGIFEDRKVYELIDAAEKLDDDEFVFVLHGEDDFSGLIKNKEKVKSSHEVIDFAEVSKIISSATIGIAFYNIDWPNARLTAFSSEKIARYLQAGVPFIAFENESYNKLKSEFNCCELIKEFSQFKTAIETIISDYNNYRINSYKAYEKYYNIKNTIRPLVDFINN